jgi:CheY-like chemotaxis protein
MGKRILFIDDEDLILEYMYEMLSDMGHNVVIESDGRKAIERFLKNPQGFDLILTDLMMLETTGDKVSENIHSIRPDIPIVVMTGTPDNISRDKATAAGICKVLPKPLTKMELCRELQDVLH